MQKNKINKSDNIELILDKVETLLKEIISESKKKNNLGSLRKQAGLPMNMPLSDLFTLGGVMSSGEGVSEKMIRYGKFINEYLSEYLDEDHELYDIVEDYDVFDDIDVLIDKWIDLEFIQNIMKYKQWKGDDFSQEEYLKLGKESEQLANEIYKLYGSFKWISDAENKMQKLEKDFAKENPDYLKWASQNKNQTSLNVFESKKNKPLNKPMKGDVKKYKVYVRDKKTGKIKKVNFCDPNMEIKRDDPERRKSFRARHKCDTATDKTTPRYWSCKFWSNKNVSDILSEIVDPKSVEVEYIKTKDQLNPKIWKNDDKIKPEVRAALLKNAIEFIKFLNLEKLPIKDIRFTGSLANYTWTDFSDLDVHVVIDFNELDVDNDTLKELFKTKKSLWETKVKAKVKGYDVEVYVEDINEDVNSTGVYSLIKDQWIEKPIKQIIGIDTSDIQLKSASLMNLIDHLESLKDSETKVKLLDALKEKIANYRKAGLQSSGEFSTENLVFKILRNNGYLKKLKDAKYNTLNKELTLENMKIKIKESQYNALIERKIVKSILEKIEYSRKTLNESEQIDEAISNTLKDYLRKGLLTVGVIAGLMANNVSAQELQAAGVPIENIAKAEQMVSGKEMDLSQIEKAFIRQAEKSDRDVLRQYKNLPDEKKIEILKAIRNNIEKLSDISKMDFGLFLGSKLTPDQAKNFKLHNIGKEVVKVVSVDTVYTTSSTPVGNYFAFNSSKIENPEVLRKIFQEIMDSYTKIDKIEIVSSSSTLRNRGESEGKTWLELSTERANAVKNILVGMKTSFGGCGVNSTEISEEIISVNPYGTNGDGTSGPKSPYEVNPKYIQAYKNNNIDPKFWQSAAKDAPLENIDDYKQYQYVNVVITGTVMVDKVEEMPNYDYLSMRIRQEGGKIKPIKKSGKQDISVCKIQVKKVKPQKMKF